MSDKKRVAIYCRVSTKEQSAEMQLADLRKFAEQRGWTVTNEFIDTGHSGAKDRRPGLDSLMTVARKRQIDGILVWRFDRFGRSVAHLVNAMAEFNALGVTFTSFQESFDTSSPVGKVMFSVIAAMAEFERQILIERIHGGLRKSKSLGRVPGPRRAVVDLDELRRQAAAGLSCRELGRVFNVSKDTVRNLMSRGSPVPSLV
jgi:DNA invertase Pin-like site-specific DNA recombinase